MILFTIKDNGSGIKLKCFQNFRMCCVSRKANGSLMACNTCYCAQAVRNVINGSEPWEQFPLLHQLGPWREMHHLFHDNGCQTQLFHFVLGCKPQFCHWWCRCTSCLGHVTGLKKVIWKTCWWYLLSGDACWNSPDMCILPRARSGILHFGSCILDTKHLPRVLFIYLFPLPLNIQEYV